MSAVAGADPVLTQAATAAYPGGCSFYPIAGESLANAWQICFNKQGVSLVVTALALNSTAPPEGASPSRKMLLSQGDAICQSEYGFLTKITKKVSRGLGRLAERPSAANRSLAAKQVTRFIKNLQQTRAQLLALKAVGDDDAATLTAYLDSLAAQASALREAGKALRMGDLERYRALGQDFTNIGQTARDQASAYGFGICSASDWR